MVSLPLPSASLMNLAIFSLKIPRISINLKNQIHSLGHGLPSLGVAMAGAAVTVVNLKILLEARYWSWTLVMFVLTSIGFFVINTLLFDSLILITPGQPAWLFFYETNYPEWHTYNELFKSPINLVVILLTLVVALLPDLLLNIYEDTKGKLKRAKDVLPL